MRCQKFPFSATATDHSLTDLDDCLAEEVVALPRELLAQLRLEVVVLVPDADFDAVRRVVALAATRRGTTALRDSEAGRSTQCHRPPQVWQSKIQKLNYYAVF